MISPKKHHFEYITSGEQSGDKVPDWLRQMAQATFQINHTLMHEIFDTPDSPYRVLSLNRPRATRVTKIAVLAIGSFRENAAYIPFIADRSARNTDHVTRFLRHLEDEVFTGQKRQTLIIEPNNIPKAVFLNREYQEAVGDPLAYKLTADAFRTALQSNARPFPDRSSRIPLE